MPAYDHSIQEQVLGFGVSAPNMPRRLDEIPAIIRVE
jgi:hypothetical protein